MPMPQLGGNQPKDVPSPTDKTPGFDAEALVNDILSTLPEQKPSVKQNQPPAQPQPAQGGFDPNQIISSLGLPPQDEANMTPGTVPQTLTGQAPENISTSDRLRDAVNRFKVNIAQDPEGQKGILNKVYGSENVKDINGKLYFRRPGQKKFELFDKESGGFWERLNDVMDVLPDIAHGISMLPFEIAGAAGSTLTGSPFPFLGTTAVGGYATQKGRQAIASALGAQPSEEEKYKQEVISTALGPAGAIAGRAMGPAIGAVFQPGTSIPLAASQLAQTTRNAMAQIASVAMDKAEKTGIMDSRFIGSVVRKIVSDIDPSRTIPIKSEVVAPMLANKVNETINFLNDELNDFLGKAYAIAPEARIVVQRGPFEMVTEKTERSMDTMRRLLIEAGVSFNEAGMANPQSYKESLAPLGMTKDEAKKFIPDLVDMFNNIKSRELEAQASTGVGSISTEVGTSQQLGFSSSPNLSYRDQLGMMNNLASQESAAPIQQIQPPLPGMEGGPTRLGYGGAIKIKDFIELVRQIEGTARLEAKDRPASAKLWGEIGHKAAQDRNDALKQIFKGKPEEQQVERIYNNYSSKIGPLREMEALAEKKVAPEAFVRTILAGSDTGRPNANALDDFLVVFPKESPEYKSLKSSFVVQLFDKASSDKAGVINRGQLFNEIKQMRDTFKDKLFTKSEAALLLKAASKKTFLEQLKMLEDILHPRLSIVKPFDSQLSRHVEQLGRTYMQNDYEKAQEVLDAFSLMSQIDKERSGIYRSAWSRVYQAVNDAKKSWLNGRLVLREMAPKPMLRDLANKGSQETRRSTNKQKKKESASSLPNPTRISPTYDSEGGDTFDSSSYFQPMPEETGFDAAMRYLEE